MATLKVKNPGEQLDAVSAPSAQIIKAAANEVSVTDSAGRKITLRNPGPLAQFRLIEAAGDSASNRVYMSMVLPLAYVTTIDGAPVPAICTKAQLEALIQRLDNHGLEAVVTGMSEHFSSQSNPEQVKEKLKNS